jgi:type II secretory pathway component PulM
VIHIYEHIHQLDPNERKMLSMSLAERPALPFSALVTWMIMIQPAFEEAHIQEELDFDLEEALAHDLQIEVALTAKAELQAEEYG